MNKIMWTLVGVAFCLAISIPFWFVVLKLLSVYIFQA